MKERAIRDSEALSAYHDGELRGLARWRFERRLRRDPELRRELELLRGVGDAVRAGAAGAPADLWDRIALRLPAADASRAEARRRGRRVWLVWAPLGAAAAAGVAAVAFFGSSGGVSAPADGVVRWMYAGKHDVYVLEAPGAPGTTIIWVLDGAPKQTAKRETAKRASGASA